MCFSSSLNACRSASRREVVLLAPPPRDGVDDAADQLLDAALALRRADLPAEIFRDDDVGGLLRPGLGISTSRCSNTTSPRSLPMTAARSSHLTSSNGSTPGRLKKRGERQAQSAGRVLGNVGRDDVDVDHPLTDSRGLLSSASLHVFLQTAAPLITPMRVPQTFSMWIGAIQAFPLRRRCRKLGCSCTLPLSRAPERNYAPGPVLCQAGAHNILWTCFRAVARCAKNKRKCWGWARPTAWAA